MIGGRPLGILHRLKLDPVFRNLLPVDHFEMTWANARAAAYIKTILAVHAEGVEGPPVA